ncbi:MAG: PilT/PilU family type 4a pilus ATPase [Verrucomicrobiota bacterium]
MRRAELGGLLTAMMESYPGVSDLLFCVGKPFQVEAYGELKTVATHPDIQSLTPYQVEQIALSIIGEDLRLLRELLVLGSCDCGYSLNEKIRFRVNIFKQRGYFGIVMRKPQPDIPTIDSLGLPPIFNDIARQKNGLVLVTGSTGSGKTTTLASILNYINEMMPVHIVTLEDPIEFVHTHKLATFSQRELGQDFEDYPNGLRAALRQAPKVILVGEMRDRQTVEIALMAAETGHLVLSTLHTIDAGQSISRILGMFEREEESQMRLRLAETLRFVVSQRLAPNRSGRRLLLTEIMGHNLRVRETIALGENDQRTFYEIIEDNQTFGWTTFDHSIIRAYEADLITEETAILYSSKKGRITREIDDIKKLRGLDTSGSSGLRLDVPQPQFTPPKPPSLFARKKP